MFGGLNPAKLAELQSITQNIKGKVIVDYAEGSMTLRLIPTTEESASAVPEMLTSWSDVLTQQLQALCRIQGEIIERNKGAKIEPQPVQLTPDSDSD